MPRSAGDIRQGGQIDLTLTLQARQVQASLAQTAEQWGALPTRPSQAISETKINASPFSGTGTGVDRRAARHRGNLREGKELLPVRTELFIQTTPEGNVKATVHGRDQRCWCGDAKQHSSLHHALSTQPLAGRHIVTVRQSRKHTLPALFQFCLQHMH
jgi:hypothetical protein